MEIIINSNELFIDGYKLPTPLSKSEMNDLFEAKKNGDVDARNILVEHNIRLVFHQVLNHFSFINYDKKELVSVGNMGLMKAIDTFDVSKNVNFATYAIRCINNEIYMFLRQVKKVYSQDSLDKVIFIDNGGHELLLKDKISDDCNMEDDYINNETYQQLRQIVNNLPSREQEIIKMYFGFYDNRLYKQHEIANMFGLSQSYVCRLIKKIVSKISCELKNYGIVESNEEYFEDNDLTSESILHEKKKVISFM